MNLVGLVAVSTAIVWAGKIKSGDKIPGRVILGAAFLLIFLSLLSQANERLATLFGVAVLIGALFTYGPKLFEGFESK